MFLFGEFNVFRHDTWRSWASAGPRCALAAALLLEVSTYNCVRQIGRHPRVWSAQGHGLFDLPHLYLCCSAPGRRRQAVATWQPTTLQTAQSGEVSAHAATNLAYTKAEWQGLLEAALRGRGVSFRIRGLLPSRRGGAPRSVGGGLYSTSDMRMNAQPAFTPPAAVPTYSTPAPELPVVGLGTFGSDHASPGFHCRRGARRAEGPPPLRLCCRLRQRAQHRPVARRYLGRREKREELWVTSKGGGKSTSTPSRMSFLLASNRCATWGSTTSTSTSSTCALCRRHPASDAKPLHGPSIKTWRQMERLVDMGQRAPHRHRHDRPQLVSATRASGPPPMRWSCTRTSTALFHYVGEHGMARIAYSPIGSPASAPRDRTPDDTVDIEDPVIVRIAERLGVHPAVVCVKWGIQRGEVVIPMSTNSRRSPANPRAAVSRQDMADIAAIDKNSRLIKGQVFLWKPGQSWEDLWDVKVRHWRRMVVCSNSVGVIYLGTLAVPYRKYSRGEGYRDLRKMRFHPDCCRRKGMPVYDDRCYDCAHNFQLKRSESEEVAPSVLPAMRLREHRGIDQPFFTTGYTPNGLEQALAIRQRRRTRCRTVTTRLSSAHVYPATKPPRGSVAAVGWCRQPRTCARSSEARPTGRPFLLAAYSSLLTNRSG